LFGKQSLLEDMPPYQGGGDMIKKVTLEETQYNDLPYKFEAGTPHIAGVIGLGAAIDYVTGIGLDNISNYEAGLIQYATAAVQDIKGLELIGTAEQKTSILSFTMNNIHPHDIGTILDHEGIAIRAGHHCAMPVMEHFKIPATARASFAFYNTQEEVDRLVRGLDKCNEIFG
jgi:cysteine desulfurase / selenocysteine lyase